MDEILFYGGLAVSGLTLFFAAGLFIFLKIKATELKYSFDKEYGEEIKVKNQ